MFAEHSLLSMHFFLLLFQNQFVTIYVFLEGELYRTLCPIGMSGILYDGLQIAFMIGNLRADC